MDQFRLRAPQHDFGELIHDTTVMESMYLFDEKEFYLQINQPEKLVRFEPPIEDV